MVIEAYHVVMTCEDRNIIVPLSKSFDHRVCAMRNVTRVSVL